MVLELLLDWCSNNSPSTLLVVKGKLQIIRIHVLSCVYVGFGINDNIYSNCCQYFLNYSWLLLYIVLIITTMRDERVQLKQHRLWHYYAYASTTILLQLQFSSQGCNCGRRNNMVVSTDLIMPQCYKIIWCWS